MSDRHIFNSSEGLVNKSLRGLIAYNRSLGLDESNRVIFDTTYDKSKISIISGGGSGHEPAWTGYVGKNMLAASVSGDIFASPSAKQVSAAIDAVPSDIGTIVVIANYTGDRLHFGLASEKARGRGHACRMIVCGDDVSVGRKGGGLVGRRGLPGQIAVLKILGGAAGAGEYTLDQVYDLGVAVSNNIVSVAATLDHCHVPGRTDHGGLAVNEVEIGTGPHNEPGYIKLSTAPSPHDLVKRLLMLCLDQNDSDRAFTQFDPHDEVVLLVSNFGGISYLEMGALVDEVLEQLENEWKIQPSRVFSGPLETSLNAPAFSISLINITTASKNCSYSTEQIKSFLDAKTNTHWESMAGSQTAQRARHLQLIHREPKPQRVVNQDRDVRVNPRVLEAMLRAACTAVIEAEPDLTRWDMIMGDGDCGETLKTGATHVLQLLDSTNMASEGSIVTVLDKIIDIVESKMGGTLGGILGIFFVSLSNFIEENAKLTTTKGLTHLWTKALSSAVTYLGNYTPAKVGDRTILDVIIPFTEGMGAGFDTAVEAAREGAEATRNTKPKLGRATYVAAGQGEDELCPDPGAWGAMVAVKGLRAGMEVGEYDSEMLR